MRHPKQRLRRLEKELRIHTGEKIDEADRIQVLQWSTEEEKEGKMKNRMTELSKKYPKASKEDFLFLLMQNFGPRANYGQ
jgi:hypothetical protein